MEESVPFIIHHSSFITCSREGDSAVNSAALAEDLIQRAWLPPSGAGLLALARGGSDAWNEVRRDPGAVLLLLRLPALRRLPPRSEEHTSELQSLTNLVCRLLLEKKKK